MVGVTASGDALLSNGLMGMYITRSFDVEIRASVFSGNHYDGLRLSNVSRAILEECFVGTDCLGQNALSNYEVGMYVQDSNAIEISSSVLSGNANNGLYILRSTIDMHNSFIGTDRSGNYAIPNIYSGIYIDNASSCIIGGGEDYSRCNIISGNRALGLYLSGSSVNNNISYNYIGVAAEGKPLPNRYGDFGYGKGAGAESNIIKSNMPVVCHMTEKE